MKPIGLRKGYPEDMISKTTGINYVDISNFRLCEKCENFKCKNGNKDKCDCNYCKSKSKCKKTKNNPCDCDFCNEKRERKNCECVEKSTAISKINKIFSDFAPNKYAPEIEYLKDLLSLFIWGRDFDSKEKIYILDGEGHNGKSIFVEFIENVMGEYVITMPSSALNDKAGTNASGAEPYKIQMLGTRFAFLSEPKKSTDGSYRINTSEVKTLTSRDKISARGLYKDNINEKASHTLIYATNHLPVIDEYDIGIWRRIELIKFRIQFLPREEYEKKIALHKKNGKNEEEILKEIENMNNKIMDENVGKYIDSEIAKECLLSILVHRYIERKYCKCNYCKCILKECDDCKNCAHENMMCISCKKNSEDCKCGNSELICSDCFECSCRICKICGKRRCEKCYNKEKPCASCKKCPACKKYLSMPKSLLEHNTSFKENSDNIQLFINTKLTKEDATDMDELVANDIYGEYKTFCQASHYELKNMQNFKEHFARLMTPANYDKSTSKLKGYKFIG
jgi:hypothetical protein